MNPIDESIAIKLFGWRWLAFDGVPECVHKAIDKTCRVRWLFPPELDQSVIDRSAFSNVGPATGEERIGAPIWFPDGPPRFHDNETNCFRMLIPAMENRGFLLGVERHVGIDIYAVVFSKDDVVTYTSERTLAEAICKAALRALEGENNG